MTTSRPMSLWRLEWIRLFRTKRWIALLGVYVFFGLVGPLTARYISEILESFGGDVQVVIPDPVAADGIASYISNAAQIGLLVAVGVAAAALVFDSKPQMGIFLRSRVKSVAAIIAPRYLVATAAIAAAFTVGSIAALYESTGNRRTQPVGAGNRDRRRRCSAGVADHRDHSRDRGVASQPPGRGTRCAGAG